MSPLDAIRICFQKYVDFTGRASRSEYWWFYLFGIAVIIGGSILAAAAPPDGAALVTVLLPILALILPSLAVTVRRLHDSDLSGWWFLISLVPFGGLALLVMTVIPGTRGPNRFGPEPDATAREAVRVRAPDPEVGFRQTRIPSVRRDEDPN